MRAARHADAVSTLKRLRLVKMIGGVVPLFGLLGFFFLQLPH